MASELGVTSHPEFSATQFDGIEMPIILEYLDELSEGALPEDSESDLTNRVARHFRSEFIARSWSKITSRSVGSSVLCGIKRSKTQDGNQPGGHRT